MRKVFCAWYLKFYEQEIGAVKITIGLERRPKLARGTHGGHICVSMLALMVSFLSKF